MTKVVVAFLRGGIATVLLLSAVAKGIDVEVSQTLISRAVGIGVSAAAVAALCAVEASMALGVVFGAARSRAFLLPSVLISVGFAVVSGWNALRGADACGCFGGILDKMVGPAVTRNVDYWRRGLTRRQQRHSGRQVQPWKTYDSSG